MQSQRNSANLEPASPRPSGPGVWVKVDALPPGVSLVQAGSDAPTPSVGVALSITTGTPPPQSGLSGPAAAGGAQAPAGAYRSGNADGGVAYAQQRLQQQQQQAGAGAPGQQTAFVPPSHPSLSKQGSNSSVSSVNTLIGQTPGGAATQQQQQQSSFAQRQHQLQRQMNVEESQGTLWSIHICVLLWHLGFSDRLFCRLAIAQFNCQFISAPVGPELYIFELLTARKPHFFMILNLIVSFGLVLKSDFEYCTSVKYQ